VSRRRLKGLRLLVVEDEARVAMLVEDMLQALGCICVGPAGSVAQALALLEREAVDLALLDVNRGGGERSYPVADALAARGLRFIFVTGYGAPGFDRRYDPVRVLQKPFDERELAQAIAAGLGRSRSGAGPDERRRAWYGRC
jgi:CheY-like chemotaxis protein